MTRDETLHMVCAAITLIQKQSGRMVNLLSEDSCPFRDVDGFDSLNGQEVTAILLEDLPLGADFNPFTPPKDGDLTIGEIADRVAANLAAKQEVQ